MVPSDNRGISSPVRPKRRVGSEPINPGVVLEGFDEPNPASTLRGIRMGPNGCSQRDRYRWLLEFGRYYHHLGEWLGSDRDWAPSQTYWWRRGRSIGSRYKLLHQPTQLDLLDHHPTVVPVHWTGQDGLLERKRREMDQPGSGIPASNH